MTESDQAMSTAGLVNAGSDAEPVAGGANPCRVKAAAVLSHPHTPPPTMSSNAYPYAPPDDGPTAQLLNSAETDASEDVKPETASKTRPSIDFHICLPVWFHAVPFISFASGVAAASLLLTLVKLCFEKGRQNTSTAEVVRAFLCAAELAGFAILYGRFYTAPLTGADAQYDRARSHFQYALTLNVNPKWLVAWFFIYGFGICHVFSEFALPAAISSLTFIGISASMVIMVADLRKRPLRRLRPDLPS